MTMAELHLECDTCHRQITLTSTDPALQFFIKNYGEIDKVTGRIFELNCLVCPGILEKISQFTTSQKNHKKSGM